VKKWLREIGMQIYQKAGTNVKSVQTTFDDQVPPSKATEETSR